MQLKWERMDSFRNADSRFYMFITCIMPGLCRDQLDWCTVSRNPFILTYNMISCIMSHTGAFVKYSQVVKLPGALQFQSRPKAAIKLDHDPKYLSKFNYDKG